MVKAVIFDMDGVLIDTEKWLNKYWRQAAAEAGYDMTVEDGLAIRSLAAKYAAPFLQERFGADFPYWTIRERRKELMKAHIAANGIDKKPGVDELLDYLRAHRIKTAVATATDPARTKDYLTRIGIYDKFDRIVCATMVENGKPKPDIYLYACEQIGEAPADCIAVEDSPNGVRSATDAGIRTVMVPDLAEPDADTAKRIAAKYNCHGAHSDAISEFACTLFDKFKNLHGLSSDKKIILQLASILHSCGQYINVRMPNQCSFDLIKDLDIFGLTHEQILLTAFVAGSDEFTMPNVADAGAIPMTEERRLEILKLVAIFRLANALDKSKRRKLRISKIRITNEKLEIKVVASGSALLEKWAFEECAGLFKEVFGLSPELQIKSELLK